MRTLISLVFALLTLPALAQGGERYDNARFGYSVSVPAGITSVTVMFCAALGPALATVMT